MLNLKKGRGGTFRKLAGAASALKKDERGASALEFAIFVGILAFGLLTIGFGLAAAGLGQAILAVRLRGSRMLPAALGLVLSGSCLGVCLGAILLQAWRT